MAFIPVPNVVLAEIRMTLDFQRVENTLYFEFPAAPAPSDLVNLGDDLLAWYTALMAPLQSSFVALREIYLTDLTSSTGPTHSVSPATLVTGGITGEVEPSNVTIATSFRTNQRGRSFRGRNYFVGVAAAQLAQNTFTPAFITSLKNVYDQLPASLPLSDATWVVVSRFSNNAPRVAGIATPVSAVVVVDPTVDSQRRRLPGRGR
jgi:hypothetical protein